MMALFGFYFVLFDAHSGISFYFYNISKGKSQQIAILSSKPYTKNVLCLEFGCLFGFNLSCVFG